MTKKSKEEELPMSRHHEQQKINASKHQEDSTLLSSRKNSNNKKFIKKPQPLTLIQQIDALKEKNHKLYKHAENKIDRIIEVIDEISQKQLALSVNKSDGGGGEMNNIENQSKSSEDEKVLINKTLTYLHNLLTYEKPLSHIKKQFQSFYSKLSSFSKDLQSESSLPQEKKFLIPEDGLKFQQAKLVQQLIKQHYLRTGQFEVAKIFDNYGRKEDENYNNSQYNNSLQSNTNVNASNKSAKRNKSLSKQESLSKQKQKSSKYAEKKLGRQKKRLPKVQLIDLEQNFYECFTLRNQLLQKNFEQPINWCQQQRLYETHSNPLEYQLRLTEIKLLIKDRKYNLAYEKIERYMVKFLDNYQQQINLLIGYLLFSCDWNSKKIFIDEQIDKNSNKQQLASKQQCIEQQSEQQKQFFYQLINQRYSKFIITQGQIESLAQKFTHQYFIHYDISQFDTLEICYKVGKLYQQQYFESIKMFSEKDKDDFLKHRLHCEFNDKNLRVPHSVILPFEIPVDKQYLYHSIFVCPVTKAVLSSNDGVEFLSCGHLVSQSAKKDMAEVRRSNHKQKCPVCQKDRTSEVIKVSF